jgi:hypothetical protein
MMILLFLLVEVGSGVKLNYGQFFIAFNLLKLKRNFKTAQIIINNYRGGTAGVGAGVGLLGGAGGCGGVAGIGSPTMMMFLFDFGYVSAIAFCPLYSISTPALPAAPNLILNGGSPFTSIVSPVFGEPL